MFKSGFESGSSDTTKIGYINDNNQLNFGTKWVEGTDYNQYSYKLKCLDCCHEYGSNGSDIHLRKCPACKQGKPGIPFELDDNQ